MLEITEKNNVCKNVCRFITPPRELPTPLKDFEARRNTIIRKSFELYDKGCGLPTSVEVTIKRGGDCHYYRTENWEGPFPDLPSHTRVYNCGDYVLLDEYLKNRGFSDKNAYLLPANPEKHISQIMSNKNPLALQIVSETHTPQTSPYRSPSLLKAGILSLPRDLEVFPTSSPKSTSSKRHISLSQSPKESLRNNQFKQASNTKSQQRPQTPTAKKTQQFPLTPRASPSCHRNLVTRTPAVILPSPEAITSPLVSIFGDSFDLQFLDKDYFEFSMDAIAESKLPNLEDKEHNTMDLMAEPGLPILKNEEHNIEMADLWKTIATFKGHKVKKLDQYKTKSLEPPAKRQRTF